VEKMHGELYSKKGEKSVSEFGDEGLDEDS
jgi:hypothetical protein